MILTLLAFVDLFSPVVGDGYPSLSTTSTTTVTTLSNNNPGITGPDQCENPTSRFGERLN